MSWDAYVDNLMSPLPNSPAGETLAHAGIFGADGSQWAVSPSFPVPNAEYMKKVWSAFDDPLALGDAGLKFGDVKYIMVGGDPGNVIRGKKGQSGVCVKKTKSAMLVGIYDAPVQPGDCNVIVENLGDYLKDNEM